MSKFNNFINIAIVGLGQIGSYLYNEINQKKKEIELNLLINLLFN